MAGEEYRDYVLDMLAPLGGVSARRMFGGYGVYKGGVMFGILFDDVLYFKVTDANRAEYEELKSEPFRYQSRGKTVALSFWAVPAEALDDDSVLLEWADKSCRAARAAKDKAPKKKTKAKR